MAEESKKKGGRPPGTHCKNGHEYTPENTLIINTRREGQRRSCKICSKANKDRQKVKAQKKAERKRESWFF